MDVNRLTELETWVNQAKSGYVRTVTITMNGGDMTSYDVWLFDSVTQVGVNFTADELGEDWQSSPKWNVQYQEQLTMAEQKVTTLQGLLGDS